MKIEEALTRFIGEEVLLYTIKTGDTIECTLNEIGDGWLRIAQQDGSESIVNTANIVRVREYPRNKNGKKKLVLD